jgi:serine protease
MLNKIFYFILSSFLLFQHVNAQSNYFYYNNKKVYLNIDTEYIAINSKINIDFFESYGTSIISRSEFVENHSRNYAYTENTNLLNRKSLKNYYCELKVSDAVKNNVVSYTTFINTLNLNSNTIKVSPSYKTNTGKRLGITNNFYVKINSSSLPALLSYAQNNNIEVLGRDPYMENWYILACTKSNPKNALEYSNQFYESGLFIAVEPEFVYHDLGASNDPYYNNQWALSNTGQYGSQFAGVDINVNDAWNITKGNNVKVAIYDNGIDLDHPDLLANISGGGFDAHTNTTPSHIRGNHGTACAGIVGAVQNNNIGISGVAPECDLVSISFYLNFSTTPIQLASGFNWAWQNGVEVISNSWGGYTPSNIITDAIYNAINLGRNGKGCIVVFAAGNENDINVRYPGAAIPEILVVGAMSPCAERKSPSSCDGDSWGSCYGPKLDIVAPGTKIPTTDNIGIQGYTNYDYYPAFNGTSSACPHVAGVAALILSVNPCLTAKQVVNIIEQTAQKVGNYTYSSKEERPNGTWNEQMGYGLVDAFAAIKIAQSISSEPDLMVKDGNDDVGLEPNLSPRYMWTSDNIWVRNNNDAGLIHQNPEFSSTGGTNFVKVRVINNSCTASSGNDKLKLYWAKASTALSYPNPWLGGVSHPSTGASMGNAIGTLSIPALDAGEEIILTFPWKVPNPANYGDDGDQWHFCLLARIESLIDPMVSLETSNLNLNVRNNNNIAWKNITVVDVLPNLGSNPGGVIAVGNPFDYPKTFSLELEVDDIETGKPIYQEAEIGIKMDNVVYDAWERGGRDAILIESTLEEKRKLVKGNNVLIENISFNASEIGTIRLDFNFLTKELTNKENYVYHVIQKDAETGQVIGGETFVINKTPRPIFEAQAADKEVDKNQSVTIIAEDINEPAIYNWYDSDGNLIFEGKNLEIANAVAEKFKLEVISTTDGFKDYKEVEVKIKPSIIDNISPNPATNNVLVNYKLNEANSAYLMIISSDINNQISNNYIIDVNSSSISINLNNYISGYYTIALVVDGEIVDAKILIKL